MRDPRHRRALLGYVAAGLALASGSGCVSIHLLGGSRRPLVESVVHGETGPKILLLDIEGVIHEAPARPLLGLRRRPEPFVDQLLEYSAFI